MHPLSTEIVESKGKRGPPLWISYFLLSYLFFRKHSAEQKTNEWSAVHELPEESNREV